MKYCLLGLMCLLLGTTTTSARVSARNTTNVPKASYIISQKEATHNAVCYLYYIYKNTPKEAVSIDNPSLDLKVAVRLLSGIYKSRDCVKSLFSLNKAVCVHLHPDPIGYYVYTLEKIVI